MSGSNTIKIGIIGGGGIVKSRHLPGFSKIQNVSIAAICNRSRSSSEAFAKEYKVNQIFSTPEELISDKNIDAVLIGTWPYKHCEYTLKALEANKHVFVQARMCMNLEEAIKMHKAAKTKPHLAAMICPSPFGFTADLTIRKLMAENFVGKILTVKYTNLGKFNAQAALTWRHSKTFSGLNIMGIGIYYETISRWVGHAQEVFAFKTLHVKERMDTESKSLKPVEIEDDVIITGRLKNGASFNYQFGSANHPPAEKLEIYGVDGTIVYQMDQDILFTAKQGQELKPHAIDEKLKKEWQVEQNFIQQIETGKQQEATFDEGLQYMTFMQAIYDSGLKKSLINVDQYLH